MTATELTTNQQRPNSLGTAGFVVSTLGLICCMFTLFYCWRASGTEIESNAIEGNILPPGSMSFFHFLLVSAVGLIGSVTGATLSTVGVCLSLAGLFQPDNVLAKLGLLAGIAGPLIIGVAIACA